MSRCIFFTFLVVVSLSSLLPSVTGARPIQDTLPSQTDDPLVNTPTNSFSFSTLSIKKEEKELTSPPPVEEEEEEGKRNRDEGPGKAEVESPESKEEGEKGAIEHRSFNNSKAGGEIILGGLATAVFAVVFCYIRVTRKRSPESEEGPPVVKERVAAEAEASTVIKEESP